MSLCKLKSIRAGRWTSCIPLTMAFMLAIPLVAQACDANPNNLVGNVQLNITEHEAGDYLTGWDTRQAVYLVNCSADEIVDMTMAPDAGYVGRYRERETFATSNPNIGFHVDYQYPNGRDSNGDTEYTDWAPLDRKSVSFAAYGNSAADIDKSRIQLNLDVRFVALGKVSGNQTIESFAPVRVTLDSADYSMNQFVWEKINFVAPRESVCWFVGSVDGMKVDVPYTHISMLKNEGDMGSAQAFSWSWRCDGGAGELENPNGDFRYKATTTVTDKEGGRMSVTGGAGGVDLLVTRRDDDGEQEPIEFDYWYSGRKNLGLSGTERMEVRFIRNKDALVPGPAEAGLLIEIEPK